MSRFTVYSVLGDGNAWDVGTYADSREAVNVYRSERQKYASYRHHAHGIYNPDDPERGDITFDLEEAELEEIK